jgi:hypothetical protein
LGQIYWNRKESPEHNVQPERWWRRRRRRRRRRRSRRRGEIMI